MNNKAQCIAPINIAVLKYWGKLSDEDMLPCNPSVSFTLSTEAIYTETCVRLVEPTNGVTFCLNGDRTDMSPRMLKVLNRFVPNLNNIGLEILSVNSFPSSSGMASSASGMCSLVMCLDRLFATKHSSEVLAEIARLGSGSACRSIFGGVVLWDRLDTRQLFSPSHWPELRCLILVLSGEKKIVSSTMGMKRTMETSDLFSQRLNKMDEKRTDFVAAIASKNFACFAKLVMKESNQLHAVCMDSFPPIHYLNDASCSVINQVHALNEDKIIAAYTFDAGPNAFIFTLQENLNKIQEAFKQHQQIVCSIGTGPHFID